jgi:hypothetical protein
MTITAPPPPSPWARQVRSAALQASPWRSAGNPYANITASLDNAGTITGPAGGPVRFERLRQPSSILNRSTGTIGAIGGGTSSPTTAPSRAARSAPSNGTIVYGYGITNTGTITSSSAAGTIANYSGTITNSGTISNTGTGAAITSTFDHRQSGGRIDQRWRRQRSPSMPTPP